MNNIISLYEEVSHLLVTPSLLSEVTCCVEKALDFIYPQESFSVSLSLTNDENIRKLNYEFRGIDRSTDVLSFPQYDFISPKDPADNFIKEEGSVLLGDIVLSSETAIRQSEEYGHSLLRELVFLCVHSLLHLFGYDHITDADRALMEEEQNIIMMHLGINR
ncbi:MAG: rRNA maturation RNase YbeY [Eubacteriales bacterium]|nr:rRNA maturation RNase YbeY [Eubacteriales bacterium]MDD4476367.1 rRNA maturation RNase YbeY [Eubacteriales bacterium]